MGNVKRFASGTAQGLLLLFVIASLSAFTSSPTGNNLLYSQTFIAKIPHWDANTCYDVVSVAVGSVAYVADDTNASVEQIRGANAEPIGTRLFQGPAHCTTYDFSQQGPNGVLVVGSHLWAADGDNTVKVFDLSSKNRLLATISLGAASQKRADEIDYIATTNQVVVASPDAKPHPYLTYIDATTLIKVGEPQVFNTAQSLEQPRFSRGLLYLAIPGTFNPDGSLNNNGEIDEINPVTRHILRTYAMTNMCGASGLSIIGTYAATGCAGGPSQIVNLSTGHITVLTTGKAADMVAGDDGLGRFFFADYGTSRVLVTDVHGILLQSISTDAGAHSVAIDQQTHRVYVPIGSLGGVAEYSATC